MLHLIVPPPLHRAALRLAYRVRNWFRRTFRPQLRGVCVIATNPDGAALLVRHSYGSGDWCLPGGGCGAREDPAAAARREMHEELGIELAGLDLLFATGETLSGAPHTAFVFVAAVVGDIRPDGREIVEAGFFSYENLPRPLSDISAARLAAWQVSKLTGQSSQ